MELDIEKILDILGNKTRRKILAALSEEAGYVFQLSEDINIRHQAIRKHLAQLKELKIIKSYEGASTVGGPPRKYFKISKSFSIMADITPDSFETKLVSFKRKSPERGEYAKLTDEIETICNTGNSPDEKISDLNIALENLNSEIEELEKKRLYLVELRQQILKYIKTTKNNEPSL
ncbi:MAG: ArsR/SmtB family transcription factor [Promethearchaeota archaeon]